MQEINKTTFEETLDKQGVLVYTNVGVSMRPLIRQGRDVMVIRKKGEGRLNRYDAVLFKRSNGQYILHRILKVCEKNYYIVGDNCASGEYVADSQILGVLDEIIRGERHIKVTDRMYKVYVHLWCDLFWLRSGLIRIRDFVRRMGGKVLRKLGLRK
ncbi:MAG: hypothetical protein MJ166_08955 [Clostridia bacterium]|nr:hypothetical protein [Clostridia bacterium]